MSNKFKLLLTPLLALMLLAPLGCGEQEPSEPNLQSNVNELKFGEAQAGQQAVLSGNDVLLVRLEIIPANGFQWIGGSSNPGVLEQVKASDVGPEIECPEPFVPGKPCIQVLRFIGKKVGKSKVNLVHQRPWEAAQMPGQQPGKTYSLDVNVKQAFRGTYVAPKAAAPEAPRDPGQITAPGLPTYFDWRDQGIVTSVKDQGYCGSCWAFGATAVVEAQIAWKDGVHRDLSEQYLVNCNSDGFSCAYGGWWTYDYFIDKTGYAYAAGSVYESDSPYYASDGSCNPPYPHHEKLNSWAYCDDVADGQIPYYEHWPSTAQVKQKIYDNGPVGTVVCSNTWGSYYGGVFYSHCSTATHIVAITGWDDYEGVFFIKNSWGSGWGEGGYMRLPYGYCLVGYHSTYASYGGGGTNLAPVANANGPYSGQLNTSINFSSAGSNDPDGTISSYAWNFGDGYTSTSANPSHSYTSLGSFTVTLTVTDNLGATGTDTTTATITDSPTPIPDSSCQGRCGGQAPSGCYCDTACVSYGDCCADYDQWCGTTPPPSDSCEGICGQQAPSGCWCDTGCVARGDCCPNYDQFCGTPTPDSSCNGFCDELAPRPSGCYCDEDCESRGDCCADFFDFC